MPTCPDMGSQQWWMWERMIEGKMRIVDYNEKGMKSQILYLIFFNNSCINNVSSKLHYNWNGWLHLEENCLNFLKMTARKAWVQYHNIASLPVWFQIQYGRMLLLLDRLQIIVFQIVQINQSKWGCLSLLKTNTYQMTWTYLEHVPFLWAPWLSKNVI